MKERYLLKIKSKMFWHFSSAEIEETLADINTYFEAGVQEGLSEEEIMERYGKPELVVGEMWRKPDPIERKRKKSLCLKGALLVVCILCSLFSFIFCPLNMALCMFVAFSSVFIWFLAGNNCVIEILEMTEEKKCFFWRSQGMVCLLFLILQCSTFIILPYLVKSSFPFPNFIGRYLSFAICTMVMLLLVATVYFLREMLHGNIYMYFVVIQNVAMICGLLLYYNYLGRLDTMDGIRFIFTPYLISLPVLFVYLLYMLNKSRGNQRGCTN